MLKSVYVSFYSFLFYRLFSVCTLNLVLNSYVRNTIAAYNKPVHQSTSLTSTLTLATLTYPMSPATVMNFAWCVSIDVSISDLIRDVFFNLSLVGTIVRFRTIEAGVGARAAASS